MLTIRPRDYRCALGNVRRRQARLGSSLFVLLVFILFFGSSSCEESPAPATAPPTRNHLVAVARVVREDSEVSRVRTGTLRAEREVKIFSQEEGRITDLPYREGDPVREGDMLFRLDDTLLRSQRDKAQAVLNQAKQDLKRLNALHAKELISEEELFRSSTGLEVARAEAALLETRLGYTNVRSPITGVVSGRYTEPGNVVPPYFHIMTIIDTASLVTEVSVSDLVLPLISLGDRVELRIDALGDRTFDGSVYRIHPTVDATTRRGTIEVAVRPVPPGARPGQLCRVRLLTRAGTRLVVPFAALRRDAAGEFVFRVGPDNTVERAPVRSGLHLGERIEIVEGLDEGQQVVTKGFLGLAPGKNVKPVTGG